MPNLDRPARRLDDRSRTTVGGGSIIEQGGSGAAPGVTIPGAPSGFRVAGTALVHSAVTPRALTNLEWRAPASVPVAGYLVEWATDAGFTTPVRLPVPGDQTSVAVGDLPCGVTVWFRISTVAKGGVQGDPSAAISALTPSDTVPPDPPTNIAWTWQKTGDLLLTWNNPTNANFRDVEIRIWSDAAKAVHYTTAYASSGSYTWSLAENLRATSNQPDTAVYVELRARSYGGVFSAPATPAVQPSKAPPATPAGLTIDFTGRDAVFRWTAATDATRWQLTLDSRLVGDVGVPAYTYPYAQNRADHGGSPDPTLSYSLVALDGLGQPSAALTGTASNPAPGAVSITISPGGNEALGILLGQSSEPDLADLPYRVRLYRDAVQIDTVWLTGINGIVQVKQKGGYTADVTVFDAFGQPSPVTTSASVALDPLTLATLREPLVYRDNISTTPSLLKAVLADGQS